MSCNKHHLEEGLLAKNLPFMNIDEYQHGIRAINMYPKDEMLTHLALGLAGEAGEVANKVKKIKRDKTHVPYEAIIGELGGVLWYLVSLCDEMGITVEELAYRNYDILMSRQQRGVLSGSGDNR